MSSSKRASLSNNSPLDQLFRPTQERESEPEEETPAPAAPEATQQAPAQQPAKAREGAATSSPFIEESAATQTEEVERELRQTTIMIYADQADWLDEASYLARRESGSIVSKAAILRTLVEMAREDDYVRRELRERLGIG